MQTIITYVISHAIAVCAGAGLHHYWIKRGAAKLAALEKVIKE
jgi:hypothetical protein